jgi:hypothetical protein
MENLLPIQKLDIVLNFLKTQKEYQRWFQIRNKLNDSGIVLDGDDFVRIIDKLINDGYLIEIKKNDQGTSIVPLCLISYSGYLFEGYQEQKRINDINQNITETKERVAIRNENRLVVGTWVAGIVGALLLLWQIFIYIYPIHKDFPYWIWETIPKK